MFLFISINYWAINLTLNGLSWHRNKEIHDIIHYLHNTEQFQITSHNKCFDSIKHFGCFAFIHVE